MRVLTSPRYGCSRWNGQVLESANPAIFASILSDRSSLIRRDYIPLRCVYKALYPLQYPCQSSRHCDRALMAGLNFLDVVAVLSAIYLFNHVIHLRKPRLPPGPARLPLIGNLLHLTKGYNWFRWAKHKDLYGPISSITVMGQSFIILNDQKCSTDLLEKRGSIYADRPTYSFANLCLPFIRIFTYLSWCSCVYRAGFAQATPLLMNNHALTIHRRNMHRYIGSKDSVSRFYLIGEFETRRFVSRVLERPNELYEHVKL